MKESYVLIFPPKLFTSYIIFSVNEISSHSAQFGASSVLHVCLSVCLSVNGYTAADVPELEIQAICTAAETMTTALFTLLTHAVAASARSMTEGSKSVVHSFSRYAAGGVPQVRILYYINSS